MPKYFTEHIVDAIQYLEHNHKEIIDFLNEKSAVKNVVYSSLKWKGKNIEYGDWVVNDNGIIEIMKPNHFENKYKPLKTRLQG